MKLIDTFMSSPICVIILKYQCIPKNFPLLCRQFFQFITLKQTIFFSQLQLANNFFTKKVPPWLKNNGPSLTWILREARGGLKATVSNRVKPDYHFIGIVFCSFLFLSARFLCSLAGYAQKHVSTYWILWA